MHSKPPAIQMPYPGQPHKGYTGHRLAATGCKPATKFSMALEKPVAGVYLLKSVLKRLYLASAHAYAVCDCWLCGWGGEGCADVGLWAVGLVVVVMGGWGCGGGAISPVSIGNNHVSIDPRYYDHAVDSPLESPYRIKSPSSWASLAELLQETSSGRHLPPLRRPSKDCPAQLAQGSKMATWPRIRNALRPSWLWRRAPCQLWLESSPVQHACACKSAKTVSPFEPARCSSPEGVSCHPPTSTRF